MPRDARDTRRRILANAYKLFYREGFERAGVDAVAEASGVTKRTLYNHFPSKDQLIAEVLEAQAEFAAGEIRRWCQSAPSTPVALIEGIFSGLREWTRQPEWRGSGFTRAAMELAWAPGHPARRAAATQKLAVERAVLDALVRSGAEQPEKLARALVLLIEGANALCLIHGEEVWIDLAEEAAKTLAGSAPRTKKARPPCE
jgi:AcrR family transcriptional regulator